MNALSFTKITARNADDAQVHIAKAMKEGKIKQVYELRLMTSYKHAEYISHTESTGPVQYTDLSTPGSPKIIEIGMEKYRRITRALIGMPTRAPSGVFYSNQPILKFRANEIVEYYVAL